LDEVRTKHEQNVTKFVNLKIVYNFHFLHFSVRSVLIISTLSGEEKGLKFTWGLKLRALVVPPNHLLMDSAPNLGPLIFRWEINKFEDCWYESVRILEVLKLLFQQFWFCQVSNEI
jgi:hypothetical protein